MSAVTAGGRRKSLLTRARSPAPARWPRSGDSCCGTRGPGGSGTARSSPSCSRPSWPSRGRPGGGPRTSPRPACAPGWPERAWPATRSTPRPRPARAWPPPRPARGTSVVAGAAMWAQLAIGLQWSVPRGRGITPAIALMSGTLALLAVLALFAAAPVVVAAAGAVAGGRGRPLLLARPADRRGRRRPRRRWPALRERLAWHRRAPARPSWRRAWRRRGVRLGGHDVDHLVLGAPRGARGVPCHADRLDGAVSGRHWLRGHRRRGTPAPRAAVTQSVRLSHPGGQHRVGRARRVPGRGPVLARGRRRRARRRGPVPRRRDRPGRIRGPGRRRARRCGRLCGRRESAARAACGA